MSVFVSGIWPAVKCDECKAELVVDKMPATGWVIGEQDSDGDYCPKHNTKKKRRKNGK